MIDKTEIRNNRIDHIYRLLDATTKSMEKIKVMLKNLDKDDQRQSYHDVDGIMGTYDGVSLVSSDGQKYDVPANYAAKSRLVIGDTLKMIEDQGKQVFKQIEKVDRKKVEGIMTKKEGKWHIISDSGTYRVSDIAADFQHAELNDEASAFVPAKNLNVLFAALDTVKKKLTPKPPFVESTQPVREFKNPVERVTAHGAPAVPVRPAKEQLVHKPISNLKPTVLSPETPRPASKPSSGASESRRAKSSSPGPFRPKTGRDAKPFKRAAPKKEYVEDIVRPETPAVISDVNLDDDDLR